MSEQQVQQTCPQTGQPCGENPPCNLVSGTGRTYCVQWVGEVRKKATEAQQRE